MAPEGNPMSDGLKTTAYVELDLDPQKIDPAAFALMTGGLLLMKSCKICGVRIMEGKHESRVSIAHLDAKHPGWRA